MVCQQAKYEQVYHEERMSSMGDGEPNPFLHVSVHKLSEVTLPFHCGPVYLMSVYAHPRFYDTTGENPYIDRQWICDCRDDADAQRFAIRQFDQVWGELMVVRKELVREQTERVS